MSFIWIVFYEFFVNWIMSLFGKIFLITWWWYLFGQFKFIAPLLSFRIVTSFNMDIIYFPGNFLFKYLHVTSNNKIFPAAFWPECMLVSYDLFLNKNWDIICLKNMLVNEQVMGSSKQRLFNLLKLLFWYIYFLYSSDYNLLITIRIFGCKFVI